MKINRTAQSAVEYLVLSAAVLTVLIIFLNPFGNFRNNLEQQLNGSVDLLDAMVDDINVIP